MERGRTDMQLAGRADEGRHFAESSRRHYDESRKEQQGPLCLRDNVDDGQC